MKNLKAAISLLLLTLSFLTYAQERPQSKKIKISGKIIEKATSAPLGYATVTLTNSKRPDVVTGGMTDEQGNFSVEANAGTYDVKFEFISFKIIEMKQQNFIEDKNFGTVSLEAEAETLDAVEIRAERSTVEIKLDKKVYNVGSDMIVKGGTVSDVLDNVPSVSVDVEGNVSLRGNENVRILIDGRPSGGINIADVLKLLPADAIDKVEVITNPSARYDAEGGGGIINIVMKKGKNQGITGTVTLSTGDPANHGVTGTINYKTDQFNLFTTQGYSYRKGPGNSMTDTEYLDELTGETTGFLEERRNNERLNKSYNGNFGIDLFLNKSTTWTNTFSYRRSLGENPDNVMIYNFDANKLPTFATNRLNNQSDKDENIEFSSNLVKNFKKDGHKLTVDFSVSKSNDDENSFIDVYSTDLFRNNKNQTTSSLQDQNRTLLQADYVLPIGEKSQFEAGYRGNFTDLTTDYAVQDLTDGVWVNNNQFTNVLEYKEKVNALYSQFGSKINDKLSYLFGLRWEDSNIDINQFTQNIFKNKKYNNFFPSAFLAYEFSEGTSASLSYSRRISRPRSRSINPFSSLSSNINLFRGNPDLDPSMSDAFDLGFLKKWNKVTFNTSMYFNRTNDAVQFVRNTETLTINNVPTQVLVSSPVNIGTEDRFGFEFTLSYNPYKWWRMNSNFNFFRNQTEGSYTYTNLDNEEIVQDFGNTAYSWFAKINSRINLPLGIDWQTNGTYNAPQTNAQGKSKGIASMNLAFSKDVLKDKATIALNVNDVFNSRKRISETNLPSQNTYSEMQWRERQISLTFTYRFNKQKTDKEKMPKRNGTDSDNGGEEYMGG